MMNPHPPSISTPLGEALEASFGTIDAVCAIAPAAARLLAANGPGADWLGVRCPPEGVFMDAAMPAIATLRSLIASNPAGARIRMRLTFWSGWGVRSAISDIALVAVQTGEVVAVVSIRGASAAQPENQVVDGAGNSRDTRLPVDLPPVPQDDRATLLKIARRIREGQAMRAPNPPPNPGGSVTGSPAEISRSSPKTGPEPAIHTASEFGWVPPGDEVPANHETQAPGVPEVLGLTAQFAKLAHELKTPISAIVAAAEIMRDERLGPIENPRYKGYAADIFESARHALYVINNLLEVETLEQTNPAAVAPLPMVFAELDLNAIIESCVSSMRPLAEQAGLDLAAEPEPRLPHVIADATAVRQIALNLISNSVKFTPPGGSIRLSTSYRTDGQVVVEVQDNGRGMTAQEIARAIRSATMHGHLPGVAIETETAPTHGGARRPGGGLGIGLPLVGALALANGARIDISSEPMHGTTVAVVFGKDRAVPK